MKATQWVGKEDNQWQPTGPTHAALEPGFYKLNPGGMFTPWYLEKHDLKHDNVIPTGLASEIAQDITTFLGKKEVYKKYGFLHKRGILMTGRPGIGKTMTAMLLCQYIVKSGGIAVSTPNPELVKFLGFALSSIREVHPDLPILNLMEDVDQHFRADPTSLLKILDGEDQVDNIVHVATTNFLNRLDGRLTNRPGRFDRVVNVPPPDADTRRSFLTAILSGAENEKLVKQIVEATDGFLLSHLHGVIAGHIVQEQPLSEVIEGLRKMNDTPLTSQLSNKKADKLYRLATTIENMAFSLSENEPSEEPAA